MTQLNPRDVTPPETQPKNNHGAASHDLSVVAVGIDSYPSASEVTTLSCAANDAEAVHALFNSRRTNSSSVLLVNKDATVEAIKTAILNAAVGLSESGVLLVTFSGHGAPLSCGERAQAAFFTTEFTGYNGYNESEFGPGLDGVFTLRDVKDWLNEARLTPHNLILVMDSCGSGASIAGAGRNNSISLDGHRAIQRSVGLRNDNDENVQRLAEIPVDLAPDTAPWPSGSCVVAMSAATAGGAAYEIPEVGHGVLSLLALEWFNLKFLSTPDGSEDVGRDLYEYVTSKISRLRDANGPMGQALQEPDRATHRTVAVQHNGWIVRAPVAHNLLAIGRGMPVPKPYGDDSTPEGRGFLEQFERNAESIAGRVGGAGSDKVGDTNFVVSVPRFYGTRALLQRVSTRLTQAAGVSHPVLYLGLGRIRKVLPLIGSLESAFDMLPGRQTNVAAGQPIIGTPSEALIDNFVERLSSNRACVIAPFRDQEADPLMKYFLRRCSQENQITLLVALYAGEPIPEWISQVHYQRLQIDNPRGAVEARFNQLETGGDVNRIPSDYLNSTVLHWLEKLRERQPNVDVWRDEFSGFALPYYQSGNSVRAVLNALECLLPTVGQESADALELLKAISVVSLPRSARLVESLWKGVTMAGRVGPVPENEKEIRERMDAALDFLLGWRLIRESENVSEDCPRHFFVHSLVREAAREHELRQKVPVSPRWPAFWSQIGGQAYAASLDDRTSQHWWPRPILAHEAIRHLLEADDDVHACRTLLKHWRELVDAGYHETMLDWSQRLYTGIVSTGLKEQAERESLQLVIPLLVNQQTLRKHRQEWYAIQGLHVEVEQRIEEFRALTVERTAEDRPELTDDIEKFWMESRQNLANYNFVIKNFDKARSGYEECYAWAVKNNATSMECSNQIRLASCDVLTGRFDSADERMSEIDDRLKQFETTDPAICIRQSRHLRSVRIESARIRERCEELYELSLEAWTQALRSYGISGGQERFDLAIANVHMAWACLSRGEFLRAWRHSLQSRRLLNDRGIAELWWYGETERIAALAIAYMFREPPEVKGYSPWFDTAPGSPRSAMFQFSETVLGEQRRVLEELIKVSRPKNPWRAAELMNALGQFVRYAIRDTEEGQAWLREALKLARLKQHHFLEIRSLEAIGVEALYRGETATADIWFKECLKEACGYGLDDGQGRYSKNQKAVATLAKQKQIPTNTRPEPNVE